MPYLFILILLVVRFSTIASAELLPNPVGDRLGNLPQGRWMFSVLRQWGSIQRRFQNSGQIETIEGRFNRTISWKQVVEADAVRGAQVAGLLESEGVDTDGSAGQLVGNFRGSYHATIPFVGYGITDRLGVFVLVPILHFEAQASTGYRASEDARAFVSRLTQKGQVNTARRFARALNQSFETQLQDAGYRLDPDVQRTEIGDVRIEVPLALVSRAEGENGLLASMQGSLLLPTARTAALDDLYSLSAGDGRWGVGSKAIVGWTLLRRWQWIASTGVLVPLSKTQEMRVPKSNEQELIPDRDPEVSVTGGTQLQANLQTSVQWSRSWKSILSLQKQLQLEKHFFGKAFEAVRYSWIQESRQASLTSIQAAIDFSSIRSFLEGDFLFPTQLQAAVGIPIEGKNVSADPVFLMQASLFF